MIKVGQIYQEPSKYGLKYVITRVRPCNTGVVRKYYHAICDDGYVVFNKLFKTDIEQDKLIAEYPTWKEALNSKEFKGEK